MDCFKPVKIRLSDEVIQERRTRTDMPIAWRMATFVYVPCGKCEACLSKRRSQWSSRLHFEAQSSSSAFFITLTYDDEHLPLKNVDSTLYPVVSKRDVQLFLKRFRKLIYPFKIRYFAVSEYGPDNLRPHYHMLIFNFPLELYGKLNDFLSTSWSNGFIRVDPVNTARINYVTSYCLDSSTLPSYLDKNFMLCSRRPGIGSSFLDNTKYTNFVRSSLDGFVYLSDGNETHKVSMPRYYRDKLFTDIEKQQIIDKGIEYHRNKIDKLYSRQRTWLSKRGIPSDYVTLNTPYDGSPMGAALDRIGEFKRNVKKKCKLKNRIKDE